MMLAAALDYARQGLAVFPLQPGTKRPLRGSHGLKDATTDTEQIRAWWADGRPYNVAIRTGEVVDVLDVDGLAGVISWAREDDWPAAIGTVTTPRIGGTHLYVVAQGLPCTVAIDPGVDYRGRGGYVVAPPSRIAGYRDGYRWRHPLTLPRQDGSQ